MNDYKRYTALCENGCGREAEYTTKRTKKQLCSRYPARCPVKLELMKSTCVKKYGTENPNSLDLVKERKKKTFLDRYGVESVLQLPEIRRASKKAIADRHEKVRQELITLSADPQTMTQKEYFGLVTKLSNRNYTRHIEEIDPLRLRGDSYHLDHRVSKLEGYLNNIPPYIISDPVNLEIISATSNMSKLYRSSLSIAELFESYNVRYSGSETPSVELALPRSKPRATYTLSSETGECYYCGNEAKYKSEKYNKWCCSPSHNSCPEMKKRNKESQKF